MNHRTLHIISLLSVSILSPWRTDAAPPEVPAALAPLGAKLGPHWSFKGTVLSFKADAPLTEEQWKAVESTGVRLLSLSGKGIDDAALARLAKLPLEALSIDGGSLTDAGLAPLKEVKSLKSLGLSHALQLKGGGLAAITNHPALESVSLGGTGIGDVAMVPIASLKQLRKLGLNHDQITDTGLAALANHPTLETLMFSPQMTPRLTDASLPTVATLKALKELTINDTVLSYDGGLKLLKSLSGLQKLTLGKVGLADADLARLKTDLPNVAIKVDPAPPETVAKWQQQFEKMKAAAGTKK